jgi:hypothetical protein
MDHTANTINYGKLMDDIIANNVNSFSFIDKFPPYNMFDGDVFINGERYMITCGAKCQCFHNNDSEH